MTTRRCPRCRLEVLEVREDIGTELRLTPLELDPMGELGCVLEGVRTFTVHASGQVAWRSPFVMRHRPAGSRARQTVHAEHRCPPPEGDSTP